MSSQSLSSIGVIEEFIAPGRRNRPGRKMTPTTVTIHNTDNTNPKSGAKAHSRFVRNKGYYILNGKENPVSWHFTVDDTVTIQHLPIDEVAFHAGSQANASSIAIEICMNPESDEAEANAKAAMLAAHLITNLGLGIGALRKHKDWTGKNCPSRLIASSRWSAFVGAVRTELQNLATSASSLALDDDSLTDGAAVHAPPIVEDYQIDHEAVAAALDDEGSAAFFSGDAADIIRRVVDELTSSLTAGGPPSLFPHGVTEIALTLPAGISLTVKGPSEGATSEHLVALDCNDQTSCEAPDDDNTAAAVSEPIDIQIPVSTKSLYAYGSSEKRFGTPGTIRAVEAIAAAYFGETGLRLGIGNISLRGGGTIPPHRSHRRGTDVDLRVPRRDDSETSATWQDITYSQSRTQRLVEIIRANPMMSVRTILFNDPEVSGVRPWKGHDNHLHVSFNAAHASVADVSQTMVPPRPFAVARSGGDLDTTLEASGFAKVLVALAPGAYARLGGTSAASAEFGAVDDSFAACFDVPDQSQAASLAVAAVSVGPADDAQPCPAVRVFPRLGVALGTVSRDKIHLLRQHRQTRDVDSAPEFSPIRPVGQSSASAPKMNEWGIDRLRVPYAWEAGFDGQGIVVGHLDTGIDARHPALAGAVHSFAEFDLTGQKIEGSDPRDSERHGTHTAGTIAGRRVGHRGQIGVAPGCQLASALVIEGGDVVARILGGLEWIVEQNAKVLNMSLGLRGYTTAFQVVIEALWDNDVLPIIAVGNEYANSSRSPGNYPIVLSVGAMGQDEHIAMFSSSQRFNRAIEPLVPDIVAPGVDVVSCIPGGGYEKMSGSSMATPHIAGLAAILRQAAPSANAKDVENAILASCIRPTSMPEGRANRGVPDAVRALEYLDVRVPITRTAGSARRTKTEPVAEGSG